MKFSQKDHARMVAILKNMAGLVEEALAAAEANDFFTVEEFVGPLEESVKDMNFVVTGAETVPEDDL